MTKIAIIFIVSAFVICASAFGIPFYPGFDPIKFDSNSSQADNENLYKKNKLTFNKDFFSPKFTIGDFKLFYDPDDLFPILLAHSTNSYAHATRGRNLKKGSQSIFWLGFGLTGLSIISIVEGTGYVSPSSPIFKAIGFISAGISLIAYTFSIIVGSLAFDELSEASKAYNQDLSKLLKINRNFLGQVESLTDEFYLGQIQFNARF